MSQTNNYIDLEDVKGLDNFNEGVRTRIICSICTGLLYEPIVCPEEHAFCSTCLTQWEKGCPLCRKEGFKKSRVLLEILNNLQVYCYYCDKLLPYEKYIKCKHSNEDIYLLLKQMRQHKIVTGHCHTYQETELPKQFKCSKCNQERAKEKINFKCTQCEDSVCIQCFSS